MAGGSHICGFYYSTHHPENPSWDQWHKHYLPQAALKSHTTILSRTSRTVLTQTFTNPSAAKAIKNVRYTFPLYDGVSVVGFTCHVGDRIIKGQVEEKERAKADFDEAVERGETAGLLEQLPDASDVFTTTVGNIPPGAAIISEITYLGELKHDAEADGIRFTIPTAIAPRYGEYPGELLSGAALPHAQANVGMEITVDAVLDDESFIKQLRSPTHPIAVSMGTTSTCLDAEPTMTKASASLSLGTAELDKDFVVQVVAKETGNPTAMLEIHPRIPHQRALMVTLVPKFSLQPNRPEIVFVCDRSGSMGGSKISTAIAALKVFLKSLPLGVKFNVCSFGSRYSFLWPKSKAYSQSSLNEAIKHVESFSSNYGGTEIFQPLKATVEKRYKDMELEVMLLTDGDVWGHEQIFAYLNEQINEKKEQIRVFTLGVGLDASSALVEGVARAGNGFSQAVGDNEKLDSKVVRMLKGALTPHIPDYSLEVKYADQDEKAGTSGDFELVEKVTDSLRVDLKLHENEPEKQVDEAPKKAISLFDESVDLDAPETRSTSSSGHDRYAHLPPLTAPAILQAPSRIPPLFPFNRSTIYLLLSPDSPAASRTPTSVILRGTSPQGPLELEIPVKAAAENGGKDETIHQLAARKAVLELEEGRGWLSEAVDATGAKLKQKIEGHWDELVEREAVRLGVEFQVGGKWCSFVALEEKNTEKEEDKMDHEWEYLEDEPQVAAGRHPLTTLDLEFLQEAASQHLMPGFISQEIKRELRRHRYAAANASVPPDALNPALVRYQQGLMLLEQQPTPNRQMMVPTSYGGSSHVSRGGTRGGTRGGGRGGLGLKGFRLRATDKLRAPAPEFAEHKRRRMRSRDPSITEDSMAVQHAAGAGFANVELDKSIESCKISARPTMPLMRMAPAASAMSALNPANLFSLKKKKQKADVGARMHVGGDEDLVDYSDEEAPPESKDDPTQPPLQRLVALQSFEGCWEWTDKLLEIVGVAEGKALASGLETGRVAATLLAIAFFRTRLADEEEAWELVVEKAEEWVRANAGGEEEAKALREEVEGLVRGR